MPSNTGRGGPAGALSRRQRRGRTADAALPPPRPPAATLLSIPLDLTILILSALPASDLAASACTCTTMRDAIDACPNLWRAAYSVRWGEAGLASAADAAADEGGEEEEDDADDDWLAAALGGAGEGGEGAGSTTPTPRPRRRRGVWRRRYQAADEAEAGAFHGWRHPLAAVFRQAAAARRSADPPRAGAAAAQPHHHHHQRGSAAAGASPAERVAAWRASRGLSGGRPAAAASLRSRHACAAPTPAFVRLPGAAGPPLFACEACGWVHVCGARRCDAARLDSTSGAEIAVCPLSGLVFDEATVVGAPGEGGGGGGGLEDGEEEAGGGGGRLGRAFTAGYEGGE